MVAKIKLDCGIYLFEQPFKVVGSIPIFICTPLKPIIKFFSTVKKVLNWYSYVCNSTSHDCPNACLHIIGEVGCYVTNHHNLCRISRDKGINHVYPIFLAATIVKANNKEEISNWKQQGWQRGQNNQQNNPKRNIS